MARVPNPHLSPDSTPWGRWASNEIADLRREGERAAGASLNGAKAQNAALAQAARQILELQTAQADLAQTQADLTTQTNKLQTTQSDLATQTNKLTGAVAQLNAASESKSSSQEFLDYGYTANDDSRRARSSYDSPTVSFTRPSWATHATVMTTAQVSTLGSRAAPSAFMSLYLRVEGSNSPNNAKYSQAPAQGLVYDSESDPTSSGRGYMDTYSTNLIPYARSFATSASGITCGVRFSKATSGLGHQFYIAVAATVFWSAN